MNVKEMLKMIEENFRVLAQSRDAWQKDAQEAHQEKANLLESNKVLTETRNQMRDRAEKADAELSTLKKSYLERLKDIGFMKSEFSRKYEESWAGVARKLRSDEPTNAEVLKAVREEGDLSDIHKHDFVKGDLGPNCRRCGENKETETHAGPGCSCVHAVEHRNDLEFSGCTVYGCPCRWKGK